MKTVISWLEGSVQGALVGKELGEKAFINLRSESKETSVKAAKDQRHLTKGRRIGTKNVAGPKEERERLDSKGEKGQCMGGGGSEVEENEDSSVDIDNILDPDGAPARRILCCSYKGCKGRLF